MRVVNLVVFARLLRATTKKGRQLFLREKCTSSEKIVLYTRLKMLQMLRAQIIYHFFHNQLLKIHNFKFKDTPITFNETQVVQYDTLKQSISLGR